MSLCRNRSRSQREERLLSRSMAAGLTQLTSTEQAVADTLRGWGAERDNEQKFWWADWTNMIRDTITAMRPGDPVMYEDDK